MTDLATRLEAIRNKNLLATPDKTDTDYAVMTRAIEALRAFDWLAGLYDDRELTRDDVAAELRDHQMVCEHVPKIISEVTGGVLSKATYPADVVISYFNDHVQQIVEDDRKDTFGPLLDAARKVVSRPCSPATGRRVILEAEVRALEAEIESYDGLTSRHVKVEGETAS
jgi:hypothetical protein